MAKDVICGMNVNENGAAGVSEYRGKKYYFCSTMCKTKFETNPELYIKSNEDNKTDVAKGDDIKEDEKEGGLTFGLGLHYDISQFGITIDYAAIDYGRFDYVNKFSLIFSF